jgi:hypothetical protein
MANAGYLCTWTAVVGGILSKIDVVSVKIATQTLSACWVVKSTTRFDIMRDADFFSM